MVTNGTIEFAIDKAQGYNEYGEAIPSVTRWCSRKRCLATITNVQLQDQSGTDTQNQSVTMDILVEDGKDILNCRFCRVKANGIDYGELAITSIRPLTNGKRTLITANG